MALSMKGKVYVIKKQNSIIEKLWAMVYISICFAE